MPGQDQHLPPDVLAFMDEQRKLSDARIASIFGVPKDVLTRDAFEAEIDLQRREREGREAMSALIRAINEDEE